MHTTNYIVFPTLADALQENQALKSLFNLPNESGTTDYFKPTITHSGNDERAIVLDAGFPMGYRPDLLRMTEEELEAGGFVFAPDLS